VPKPWRLLARRRLYDHQRQKAGRWPALPSGAARSARADRSERIRTYNFPQGRVSDHRINLTLYKLPQIIEGEALGEIIGRAGDGASGGAAGGSRQRLIAPWTGRACTEEPVSGRQGLFGF